MPSATIPQNREQNRGQRRAHKRNRAPQRYVPDLGPISEAATFLNCHERTIRRLIHDGKLRAYRVGRVLRVDMNEVYDYAAPVPPESVAC